MSVDEDTCWICLESNDELVSVCGCPSKVHKSCLARWQVQNIGAEEENKCRFCDRTLPNWKETYEIKNVEKAMFKVVCNGSSSKISVRLDSMDEFEEKIRRIFNLSEDQEFSINYQCKIPDESGSTIVIKSDGVQEHQFQSAVYLASGEREKIKKCENNSECEIDEGSFPPQDTELRPSYFRCLYNWFKMKI